MSLVGDIIMEVRERIPDAPQVMPFGLILIDAVPVTVPDGDLSPNTTIYFTATGLTAWGETIPSPDATGSVVMGSANAIQFEFAVPVGTTAINVYTTTTPGDFGNMGTFPVLDTVTSTTVQALAFTSDQQQYSQVPPTASSAFLPDTGGNFISAAMAFRMLNRALREMVRIAGGIIDVTGVQSQINTSMYRLASPFYTFVNAWYDGYPMDVVPRNFMFLRNSAAGFSGILSYEQDGPQSVIQVWPQSNRTGGSNALAIPMTPNSESFSTYSGTGFLSIGLAQIDNEVVAFSQVNEGIGGAGVFLGVTRGLGGTDPASHAINAPVTELNIRLSGYRMARTYNVGDSALTIQVPQAWETPLVLHMLSQVRSMEQDDATSKSLLADFVTQADKIAKQSRLGKIKPRQIPVWGQNTSDARNVNGIGFGWLIN